MKKYLGVKLIEAEPMNLGDYNTFKGWDIPKDEDPKREGYKVKYSDNYISWSPTEAFKDAYRLIDNLTFGLAIEALKKGFKVARKGWNGKGMYIKYHHDTYLDLDPLEPFLMIKNVYGTFNTWVPSISDLLAEDWQIVD